MTPEQDGYLDLTVEGTEQNKKFYTWLGKPIGAILSSEELSMRKAWHSCAQINHVVKPYSDVYRKAGNSLADALEPLVVPEGYFRIGEEVDFRVKGGNDFIKAQVVIDCDDGVFGIPDLIDVRRRPAWEPKDGEAVLFNKHGEVAAGVYNRPEGVSGWITCGTGNYDPSLGMLLYEAERIGDKWGSK